MRQEVAELLTEDMGESREDYSGRSMYGKSTHAVEYDSRGDYERALVFAAFALGARSEDCHPSGDADEGQLLDELLTLRTDSMGMGIIVY